LKDVVKVSRAHLSIDLARNRQRLVETGGYQTLGVATVEEVRLEE
jgi:hypothetical protein